MLKKNTRLLKNINKGLTLIELVVTVGILAIAATVFTASYTKVVEEQRRETDLVTLSNIDTSLQQILLYDEVFEEVKPLVHNQNQLDFIFVVNKNAENKGEVNMQSIQVLTDGGDFTLLKDDFPNLYNYLLGYTGTKINLISSSYTSGKYKVYIKFNGAQVSSVREYTINNDNVIITNSGADYLN